MNIRDSIKEIHFQFEQVANQRIIPADNTVYKFDVLRDHMLPNLVLSLQRFVAKIGLDEISHPSTWWDAFKERWFPEWAKKRWPVQYKTYEVAAFFPELHRHVPMTEEQIRQEFGSFHISFRDYGNS